jgi:predicted 2-oxoglutarate/Fe(II)-dependent dioxygenase YbiX
MNFNNVSRNAVCPCGSGKKFKYCHGSLSSNDVRDVNGLGTTHKAGSKNKNGYFLQSLNADINKEICKDLPAGKHSSYGDIPPGVLVIENFLDDDLCQKIVESTEQMKYKKATVVDADLAKKQEKVAIKSRDTEVFSLGAYDNKIKSLLVGAFDGVIKNYYNKKVVHYEQPQLLRYTKGGFYHYHADSEYWHSASQQWIRSMQRDLSYLLYLNDEYTGGELEFKNFNFSLRPKKGTFICFPSDHRFVHKVNQTTSGIRYAIVSWAATSDSVKVGNDLQKSDKVIYLT